MELVLKTSDGVKPTVSSNLTLSANKKQPFVGRQKAAFARCVPLRERSVHFVRAVVLRTVMCALAYAENTSHHYAAIHNITDCGAIYITLSGALNFTLCAAQNFTSSLATGKLHQYHPYVSKDFTV